MKRISYFSLLTIIFFVGLLSCTQDWLEPEPLSFYAPENVYVDREGLEALIITMKKDVAKEHYDQFSLMVNEIANSDICVPGSRNNATVRDFTNYLTPAGDNMHNLSGRLFDHAYNAIRNTNVLVSRVDQIDWDDEQDRNYLLSVAYFYRSYWYYRLINSYGDVPFIGQELTEPKLDFYTYSRWAILEKLQSDMEFAVQWLPVDANIGELTKGAANHLLTKIYLANAEFDKAINTANQVINGGKYALMTQRFGKDLTDPDRNIMWDLHRVENINDPANTETIYSIIDRFEAPADAQNLGVRWNRREGNCLGRSYNPSWWHNTTLDSKGRAGTIGAGTQYDELFRGAATCRPSPYYLYEIWDFENDLRRSDLNWVDANEILYNNPSSVDYGTPIQASYLPSLKDTFSNVYAIPHYIVYIPEQDPNKQPWGGSGDSYIFRLAETYLLRAEAYYWQGNLGQAANDLNVVRQRANALPISGGDVTIDFIFDERARELFAEEPRHNELVRVSYIMAKLNLDGYSLTSFHEKNFYYDRTMRTNVFWSTHFKPTFSSQSYDMSPFNALWPIPETVITANTLGVINQNPGYSGTEFNLPPIEEIE